MQLTEEQKQDVQNRIKLAQDYLKENALAVDAIVEPVHLGSVDPKFNGLVTFSIKPILLDIKYVNLPNSAPDNNPS